MRLSGYQVAPTMAVLGVLSAGPIVGGGLTAAGLLKIGNSVRHDEHAPTLSERLACGGLALVFAALLATALVITVQHQRAGDRLGVDGDGVHLIRGGAHALVAWDELLAVGFTYDQQTWSLELHPANPDLARLYQRHPLLAGLDRLEGPMARRCLAQIRLLVWIPRGATGQPILDRAISTHVPGHYLPPAPRTGTVLPPGTYLPVEDDLDI